MDGRAGGKLSRSFNSITEVRSQTLACLTSRKFLEGRGLASQLPIFIAAHDPASSLESRNLANWLVTQASLQGIMVLHFDVFSELLLSLESQDLLGSLLEQEKKGILQPKQLASVVHSAAELARRVPSNLKRLIAETNPNALLFSGFDEAFPHFRVPEIVTILESLQPGVPAILLYPGSYDNTLSSPVLKLFGEIEENHNYRALDLFNYEA